MNCRSRVSVYVQTRPSGLEPQHRQIVVQWGFGVGAAITAMTNLGDRIAPLRLIFFGATRASIANATIVLLTGPARGSLLGSSRERSWQRFIRQLSRPCPPGSEPVAVWHWA
jgi:hypothetical protein